MKAPKSTPFRLLMLAALISISLSGCIAIPPLINVEHKNSDSDAITRRLDAIDRRLDRIEGQMDKDKK